MEIILVVVVGVSLIATTGLYMYLVDEEEIQPYIPTKIQRGNFWDAETKKFYKWDELVELQKQRGVNND
jgi:hypothetical protein